MIRLIDSQAVESCALTPGGYACCPEVQLIEATGIVERRLATKVAPWSALLERAWRRNVPHAC